MVCIKRSGTTTTVESRQMVRSLWRPSWNDGTGGMGVRSKYLARGMQGCAHTLMADKFLCKTGVSPLPFILPGNITAAPSAGNHDLAFEDAPGSTFGISCGTMAEGRCGDQGTGCRGPSGYHIKCIYEPYIDPVKNSRTTCGGSRNIYCFNTSLKHLKH
jgi:hypothetical protein